MSERAEDPGEDYEWFTGAGADGEWFTEDDDFASQLVYEYDSNGRTYKWELRLRQSEWEYDISQYRIHHYKEIVVE
ncbi:MAG: hypothetical protein GY754_30260 [bacterium]|nr:hypothetical protein [bacterium]